MLDSVAALFVVFAFVALVRCFGLVRDARVAIAESRRAAGVMSSKALSDDDKERAVRALAIRLFTLTALLIGGSLLALALPFACIWLAELAFGAPTVDGAGGALLSWPVLLIGLLIGLPALLWPTKSPRP